MISLHAFIIVHYIDLTSEEDQKCQGVQRTQQHWIKEFSLYASDHLSIILLAGEWLSLTVPKFSVPSYWWISGDISFGEVLNFNTERGKFIQILNVSENHWITIFEHWLLT